MRPRPSALLVALVLALAPVTLSVAGEADDPPVVPEPIEETEGETDADVGLTQSAATLTEALQGKDGVRIQTLCTHCNSANVQVGGLARELVPISVDGYPVFGGVATSMVLSVLPADTVADAEVFKGPGLAVSPSTAAGGTIRLEESTPQELPRVDLSAEGGSFSRGRGTARVAGALGARVSGSIVAGRETADEVDDDDDGFNDVGAIDRDFAEGRLYFDVGRNHKFDVGASWIDEESLYGKGGFDFWVLVQDPTEDVWTREDTLFDREEYRAGWEWDLGNGDRLEVKALDAERDQTVRSQLSTDSEISGGGLDALYDRFLIEESNTWASIGYRKTLGFRGLFRVGVDGHDQDVTADSITPDIFGTEPVVETATDYVEARSAFVDFDINLAPKWRLEVGARYDDLEWGAKDFVEGLCPPPDTPLVRSKSRTSPRGTLSFKPADSWMLRLIGGGTFRAPAPIFAEVCCGQEYERNFEVAAETGTTVGFETVFQPSPDLRLSTYAARTEFDDHILRLVGWSFVYVQTYTLANISETRADTAEISMRWSPHARLDLDGSISWLSHENRSDPDVIVDVKPPSSCTPVPVVLEIDRVPYEPERTGSIAATVSLPRGSSITAQAGYTGSMLIQEYADEPSFNPQVSDVLSDLEATPGFWVATLSFRTRLTRDLELIGGVDNITDRLQNDLGRPTTDYNWGPLAGRSWRLGLRYTLDPS